MLLTSGCVSLPTPPAVDTHTYMIDALPASEAAPEKRDLVLAVGPLEARPGFDSPEIRYTRRAHELSSFVTSRWADAPARMIEPLLLHAVEGTNSFRAVVPTPTAILADVRLDTELVRLRHDFTAQPSRVEFALRVRLTDVRGRKILAVRQFDDTEPATSDDPYGGVIAANRVVPRVLKRVADFCVEASAIR